MQDWYAGRSDSSLSTSTSADGNTIHIDLMFADEAAWNAFNSEATAAVLKISGQIVMLLLG